MYPQLIKLPKTKKDISILLKSFELSEDTKFIVEPKITGIYAEIFIEKEKYTVNCKEDINEYVNTTYLNTIKFIQDVLIDTDITTSITLHMVYNNNILVLFNLSINDSLVSTATSFYLFHHWTSICKSKDSMASFKVVPCYPVTIDIKTFLEDILNNKKDIKTYISNTEYIEKLPSFYNLSEEYFTNGFIIKPFDNVIKNNSGRYFIINIENKM